MTISRSRKRSSSAPEKPRPKAERRRLAKPDGPEGELLSLATGGRLDAGAVSRKLAALRRLHGDEIYARFIHLVSHLELPPEEARRHWDAIALHTRQLAQRLERSVDFRVGLADYFVHMAPRIRNPKVIEIHLFQETQAGTLKDGLTGLYNFRFFKEAVHREMGQARRLNHPLGLVFVDVDHFKRYNDSLGHAAGNTVLQQVARVIRDAIRDMDLACRYGGEEFAVLLPATDGAGTLRVAERIVMGMECLHIPHPAVSGILTVSAGAASYPLDAETEDGLVQAADQAMYRAKALGRNRASAYSPERRRHDRHAAQFGGAVSLNGKPNLPLSGRDISQGGLFFVTPEAVPKDRELDLVLDFPGAGTSRRVTCKARVARCAPLDGGAFGVGVSLTQIAPADRLRFFHALSGAQRTPA